MGRGIRITLIVICLIIAAFSALLIYRNYQRGKQGEQTTDTDTDKDHAAIIGAKSSELGKLVFESRDCKKAISEASAFLGMYPQAAQIWNLKGACEFDLGRFDEARASFQKVLVLDPGHEAAKNYLARLDFQPGQVVVSGTKTSLDRKDFESKLGLNLDGIFSSGEAIERPANIPEYLSASYVSSKNFSDTVAYLKEELEKPGSKFSISEMPEGTVLASASETEQKFFSVAKGSPVKITIEYQKLR